MRQQRKPAAALHQWRKGEPQIFASEGECSIWTRVRRSSSSKFPIHSISHSCSVRQAASESADICLRKATFSNRDAASRHHLHSVHEWAADGPAEFAQSVLVHALQPPPPSPSCTTPASKVRLKSNRGARTPRPHVRIGFLGFHLRL